MLLVSLVVCCVLVAADQFDPTKSSTFQGTTDRFFERLSGDVEGLIVQDVIHLGTSRTDNKYKWGLVHPLTNATHSRHLYALQQSVDGILGLGMALPNSSIHQGVLAQHVTRDPGGDPLDPVFSLALTPKGGSLTLGGYDTFDHTEPNFWLPFSHRTDVRKCSTPCGYWIQVNQMEVGRKDATHMWELLQFQNTHTSVPALVDSGSTALVLPRGGRHDGRGYLSSRPAATWNRIVQDHSVDETWAFRLNVTDNTGQHRVVEIPVEDWIIGTTNAEAVRMSPEVEPDLLVLGAPFFRVAQLVFDVTNGRLGISSKLPQGQHGSHNTRGVTIPLRNVNDTFYTAAVGIGTPPQILTAVVDTGSSAMVAWSASQVEVTPPANDQNNATGTGDTRTGGDAPGVKWAFLAAGVVLGCVGAWGGSKLRVRYAGRLGYSRLPGRWRPSSTRAPVGGDGEHGDTDTEDDDGGDDELL